MFFAAPPKNSNTTGRLTAALGTAFTGLVPPSPGSSLDGTPKAYALGSGKLPNWFPGPAPDLGKTKLSSIVVTAGSTSHTVWCLRPKNFTYFAQPVAKGLTALPNNALAADPGVYSTQYRYPTAGGVDGQTGLAVVPPAPAADNAVTAGDYVCFQLADGSWQADKVASGTFGAALTLTLGTPNRNGGNVLANSPFFFFGVPTDIDPSTGQSDPGFDTVVSVVNNITGPSLMELVTSVRQGDPMILYDANATAADTVVGTIFYAAW